MEFVLFVEGYVNVEYKEKMQQITEWKWNGNELVILIQSVQ